MGTRHLICVVKDGEYKVAQYGQWDGYLSGQGQDIVKFIIKSMEKDKFLNSLDKCRFIDVEGKDKELIDSDNRTPEQIEWYNTFLIRDLGSGILINIQKSEKKKYCLWIVEILQRTQYFVDMLMF